MAGGSYEVAKYLKDRLSIIEQNGYGGRLLDVGCGMGHFLAYPRQGGWQVQGVEVSSWAAKWAQGKYDLDIVTGNFEACKLKRLSLTSSI